jgi:hypothetical protein
MHHFTPAQEVEVHPPRASPDDTNNKFGTAVHLQHLQQERNVTIMKSFRSCQFAALTSLAFVLALPSAARAAPIVFSVGERHYSVDSNDGGQFSQRRRQSQ